jgi:predicted Zn finger-like uncharacterized protein
MKIECPHCKLTGQVSDANIPPEGRGMDCPRCKTNFFIQKSVTANWADTSTDCPRCGFSTFSAERFDICPQCGLVVKDHKEKGGQQPAAGKADIPGAGPAPVDREQMLQELERLEREEQRRNRQRQESVGIIQPPREGVPDAVETPAAVRYLGGAFILLALVLMTYGGMGFYEYMNMTPAQAITTGFEDPPTSFGLYLGHGLMPALMVIVGICFLVAGALFLQMHCRARKAMEAASWLGIAFVAGREMTSMIAAFRRASSDATIPYYLVEFAGFVLMTACWSVPLIAAIWFLRRDLFQDIFGE